MEVEATTETELYFVDCIKLFYRLPDKNNVLEWQLRCLWGKSGHFISKLIALEDLVVINVDSQVALMALVRLYANYVLF